MRHPTDRGPDQPGGKAAARLREQMERIFGKTPEESPSESTRQLRANEDGSAEPERGVETRDTAEGQSEDP